MTKKWQKS